MSKSKIFLIWLLSFISGIFLGSFPFFSSSISKFFLIIILIVSAAALLVFRKEKNLLLAGGIFLFFAIGFLRAAGISDKSDNLFYYLDKEISKKGIVANEPSVKGETTSFIFETADGEKIKIKTRNYPIINYGDKLKIEGKLNKIENQKFKYAFYWPKIEILEKTGGNFLKSKLFKLKEKFGLNISKNIPEPEASLLSGLVFGARTLPYEIENDFRTLGLSHIVAVSGYNLSVIALFINNFFNYLVLPRFLKFWFSFFSVSLFVLMIGAPSSAVRAAIMAILLLVAEKEGRLYRSVNAIVFAGAGMLFINPELLRFDLGFLLSFLATLGLILLSPFLEKKLPRFISQTLSAQIFVLPVIISYFGTFSPYGLIANILILPAVPFAMFFGFLVGIFGFVSSFLSLIPGWVSWAILIYQIKIAEIFSSLPYAQINF